ncbi:hypothetical protein HDV05_001803, partial [Chytridiales sp. JEL 0842]
SLPAGYDPSVKPLSDNGLAFAIWSLVSCCLSLLTNFVEDRALNWALGINLFVNFGFGWVWFREYTGGYDVFQFVGK